METIKPTTPEAPPVPHEEMLYKAGDTVSSRNPETNKVEHDWEILGFDLQGREVYLQREEAGGLQTRTQSMDEVFELTKKQKELKELADGVADLIQ